MHFTTLLQTLLACGLVLACALYWAGRLFPALARKGWQQTGSLLRRVHAPAVMTRYATRRATPRSGGGCGGCSGCHGETCSTDRKAVR
ncbi:hypothetical protein LU298_04480 [Komagataeibacter intermedius]|uniref:Uncharacterized protein n=2 Tax=Komagataeibacter intermedius TaxID=66229 RepID=A0A0N1N6V2_9PROT|nr:DUF6587 family protein [Komagataeibacter intermedius]KPH87342.1 hypothetical protein GLUCOINTEAF2_0202179 [Komagataeibacter intermedius AF2]MCF3635755.1 hypothetical protein [Komagataeibacter intermedius]GAN88320.1 hypothetical protein Gain_0171_005 [Komagataeibacter intermedius TF2]GBQ71353.1 hypothetical protein AA0521_1889 [Komagataeibacter intermedius NRIC 0521]